MDKIIFLMFEEFVSINSELMANTGFCLYFWQKIEKKFARLDNLNLKDFNESDFSFCDWFYSFINGKKSLFPFNLHDFGYFSFGL